MALYLAGNLQCRILSNIHKEAWACLIDTLYTTYSIFIVYLGSNTFEELQQIIWAQFPALNPHCLTLLKLGFSACFLIKSCKIIPALFFVAIIVLCSFVYITILKYFICMYSSACAHVHKSAYMYMKLSLYWSILGFKDEYVKIVNAV